MNLKRNLLATAILLGICAFSLAGRPALATLPVCAPNVCAGNPDLECLCPPGTKDAGTQTFCGTWHGDCQGL